LFGNQNKLRVRYVSNNSAIDKSSISKLTFTYLRKPNPECPICSGKNIYIHLHADFDSIKFDAIYQLMIMFITIL